MEFSIMELVMLLVVFWFISICIANKPPDSKENLDKNDYRIKYEKLLKVHNSKLLKLEKENARLNEKQQYYEDKLRTKDQVLDEYRQKYGELLRAFEEQREITTRQLDREPNITNNYTYTDNSFKFNLIGLDPFGGILGSGSGGMGSLKFLK